MPWPLTARAQLSPIPVIGYLSSLSSNYIKLRMPPFRQGLSGEGYVEGQNVVIEYRLAEGQYDRLPSLAADLVDRNPTVIVAVGGTEPAKVAKAVTTTIPIVFLSGGDPLKAGLVTSLSRPNGNVTGISLLATELESKRLGILNEIVPGTAPIAALLNPHFTDADLELSELQQAARAINREIHIVHASTEVEINAAFPTIAQQGAHALLVADDPFFSGWRQQLVALAAQYRLPTIYYQREFADTGGLISYAPDFVYGYRQAGVYVGRILKGVKPANLPVMQSSKFELVINRKTAETLGISIPDKLLALADEVIE